MSIGWLLVEIVLGVLLAGLLTGALVAVGGRWGFSLAGWTPWIVVAACIAATTMVGERVRRRRRA